MDSELNKKRNKKRNCNARPCGRILASIAGWDSQISFSVTHGRSVFGGPTMLTTMTEEDWTIVLKLFEASRSRRGDKGRDDRKFLEALHFFVVHNITWRALPERFGHWNSVWKRFWRLSRAGTFEAFFDALAAMSGTAHLVQMFDSTVVRAHVSAAGAKGGKTIKRSAVRVAAFRRRSI